MRVGPRGHWHEFSRYAPNKRPTDLPLTGKDGCKATPPVGAVYATTSGGGGGGGGGGKSGAAAATVSAAALALVAASMLYAA